MTKMKSKKMSKSTFAVIIMAIAMVAMLAFGGTYAYFTAEATQAITGEGVTTATVQLNGGSEVELTSTSYLLPGATILAADSLSVTNKSNVSTWIFAILEVHAKDSNGDDYSGWQYEDGTTDQTPYSIGEGDFELVQAGVYAFHADDSTKEFVGKADATASLGAITLNSGLKGHSVDTTIGAGMNITFTITVSYVAIQEIEGVTTDAAAAYAEYLDLRGE